MVSRLATRRTWLGGLVLALLVVGTALFAPATYASAYGCRPGGSGQFCYKVEGTGMYVQWVLFERAKGGTICNPNVTTVVKNVEGRVVWSQNYSEARCWWGARSIKLNVDRRFGDDARQICGQWRDNGYFSEICHNLRP